MKTAKLRRKKVLVLPEPPAKKPCGWHGARRWNAKKLVDRGRKAAPEDEGKHRRA
jgi:hypothetical protein